MGGWLGREEEAVKQFSQEYSFLQEIYQSTTKRKTAGMIDRFIASQMLY
jgi:hypothetical protein